MNIELQPDARAPTFDQLRRLAEDCLSSIVRLTDHVIIDESVSEEKVGRVLTLSHDVERLKTWIKKVESADRLEAALERRQQLGDGNDESDDEDEGAMMHEIAHFMASEVGIALLALAAQLQHLETILEIDGLPGNSWNHAHDLLDWILDTNCESKTLLGGLVESKIEYPQPEEPVDCNATVEAVADSLDCLCSWTTALELCCSDGNDAVASTPDEDSEASGRGIPVKNVRMKDPESHVYRPKVERMARSNDETSRLAAELERMWDNESSDTASEPELRGSTTTRPPVSKGQHRPMPMPMPMPPPPAGSRDYHGPIPTLEPPRKPVYEWERSERRSTGKHSSGGKFHRHEKVRIFRDRDMER